MLQEDRNGLRGVFVVDRVVFNLDPAASRWGPVKANQLHEIQVAAAGDTI